MNYFAHGCDFVQQPYFLAGTAVPDWLSIVNRRARVRVRSAVPLFHDADARVAALARGIVRHHEDDDWFHRTAAFAELSWSFTVMVRDALSDEAGLRPSFLGHVLVELLLDAALIADGPAIADQYYNALNALDPDIVADAVNRMATRHTDRLRQLIPRFSDERFLYDYLDDVKLLFRLNQVMRRVKLPSLPDAMLAILPGARRAVNERKTDLMVRPAKEP